MNCKRISQLLFGVLTFVTAMLLSRAAGTAAEGPPIYKPQMETELLSAFAALKGHIQGRSELGAKQIEAHKLMIDSTAIFSDTMVRSSRPALTS